MGTKTSYTHTCDRCGHTETDTSTKNWGKLLLGTIDGRVLIADATKHGYKYSAECAALICPKCKEDLWAWWENPND